jgi:hypothetical protein
VWTWEEGVVVDDPLQHSLLYSTFLPPHLLSSTMPATPQTVLVTGATGLLGRAVYQAVAQDKGLTGR